MISIEKYSAEKAHLIHALSVTPEQAQFTVDNIGEMIPELKESEHPYVIMKGDQPVGFFCLIWVMPRNTAFVLSMVLGLERY